jgi:steroid delta-isomerase-like uncharacterized protein
MSVAEKLAEMWRTIDDEGRLDEMGRFFAAGYVRHSDEGDMDLEEFRLALGQLQAAFPDLTARVSNVVVEGDRAAYMWSATGTHSAPYLGAPATGRSVTAAGITISRFGEDGRIVEDWASWNRTSVLHRLGIIPIDS